MVHLCAGKGCLNPPEKENTAHHQHRLRGPLIGFHLDTEDKQGIAWHSHTSKILKRCVPWKLKKNGKEKVKERSLFQEEAAQLFPVDFHLIFSC